MKGHCPFKLFEVRWVKSTSGIHSAQEQKPFYGFDIHSDQQPMVADTDIASHIAPHIVPDPTADTALYLAPCIVLGPVVDIDRNTVQCTLAYQKP